MTSQITTGDDDDLIGSRAVRDAFGGISDMSLWRWTQNPKLNFPPPDVVIRGRRYWRRDTIRQIKARLAENSETTKSPGRPAVGLG